MHEVVAHLEASGLRRSELRHEKSFTWVKGELKVQLIRPFDPSPTGPARGLPVNNILPELERYRTLVAFDDDPDVPRLWVASPAALVGLKSEAFGRTRYDGQPVDRDFSDVVLLLDRLADEIAQELRDRSPMRVAASLRLPSASDLIQTRRTPPHATSLRPARTTQSAMPNGPCAAPPSSSYVASTDPVSRIWILRGCLGCRVARTWYPAPPSSGNRGPGPARKSQHRRWVRDREYEVQHAQSWGVAASVKAPAAFYDAARSASAAPPRLPVLWRLRCAPLPGCSQKSLPSGVYWRHPATCRKSLPDVGRVLVK